MAKNAQQIKSLINEIFLIGDGSFDQFDTDDLFSLLLAADSAYANDQPIIDDAQYDALYRYVEATSPGNNYFYGVGSEVRGGKVKLPYTMGSLTQVYEGDTQKYVNQYKLQNQDLVATEKLDGCSTLIVYDQNGKLQIAYSRGDGIEGADITRHVSKIKNVPKQVKGPMVVRAEIIFSKEDWNTVKTQIKRSGGAFYKNARNATAGLMNASESDPIAYQYLSVVAYDILSETASKVDTLNYLMNNRFTVPQSIVIKGKDATDSRLTDILNQMRTESEYEIDGIVLDVSDRFLRTQMSPSKTTLNPEYARKFKIADASNMAIATVIEVQWNISKNGYLKPRVKIEPTELVGVTVQHATGFNAAFIANNNIGPGAKVRITRSGDVIPFLVGVVEPMPFPGKNPDFYENQYGVWLIEQLGKFGDYTWTKNSNDEFVDAVLVDVANNETVQLEQLIDFAAKMGIEHIGEGNMKAVYDAGYTTITEFVKMTALEIGQAIGSSIVGKKIRTSMTEKLTNVPWYIVAGAHSAFGRGIGQRKMKKLYDAFKGDIRFLKNTDAIVAVEGFEEKTANKIAAGYEAFTEFLRDVSANSQTITFSKYEAPKTGDLSGESFLFTGFRDKKLEKTIVEKGGKIASSVSSKLTYLVAADPNEDSGKLKKAREIGTKIISRDQLLEILA